MVVDERSRHELYRRLEEVLGADAATTLIEHLPPVGWADVATKHDLAQLEEVMDIRFVRILDRFTALDMRLDDRFARVDDRFTALETRVDERFTASETRVDDRFRAFEERVDGRFARADDRAAAFEERVDGRFTAFENRFELHEHVVREALLGLEVTVEHGLRSQMNTLVFALVGTVLTMAGLAFALARFPT